MEVVVKYSDFNEIIKEVEIPIDADKRKVIKLSQEDDGTGVMTDVITMETVDDTISFVVSQKMSKSELRDFVQVLQKLLAQMS